MFMAILTLLTALSISAVAIYYSIAGLAAICPWPKAIMIMGTVLEVGKLVTDPWLYRKTGRRQVQQLKLIIHSGCCTNAYYSNGYIWIFIQKHTLNNHLGSNTTS